MASILSTAALALMRMSSGTLTCGVSVSRDLSIPFSFMGVGEKLEDLEPFAAEAYLARLLKVK